MLPVITLVINSFYYSLSANTANLVSVIWLARTSPTITPPGYEHLRWYLVLFLAFLNPEMMYYSITIKWPWLLGFYSKFLKVAQHRFGNYLGMTIDVFCFFLFRVNYGGYFQGRELFSSSENRPNIPKRCSPKRLFTSHMIFSPQMSIFKTSTSVSAWTRSVNQRCSTQCCNNILSLLSIICFEENTVRDFLPDT